MPDHRSMAEAVAHELQMLDGEKQRLEQLLDLDQSWRALRELEAEAAVGGPPPEHAGRRAALLAALAANRIYAARQRVLEAIELLAGDLPASAGPAANANATAPLSDEVVTLDQPDGSRVKVRVKARHRAAAGDATRPQSTPPAQSDGSEGLFDNGGNAVSVTVPRKNASKNASSSGAAGTEASAGRDRLGRSLHAAGAPAARGSIRPRIPHDRRGRL
jgi:hypothetical protein